MKNCSKCGKPSGDQSYCRECHNAYRREHRKQSPNYRMNNIRSTKIARAQLTKDIEIIKASTPCTDCKLTFNPWQMQFDHITHDKIAHVADLVRHGNRALVMEEIKKCELVCANCHADRTHFRNHPADVAQSVERNLAKVEVVGAKPIIRL